MDNENALKRMSILIREDQAKVLHENQLNMSGLIRDLIDDHFSEHKITLGVSEKTRKLYDQIVANTGMTDADLEKYLHQAMGQLLEEKIQSMMDLKKKNFS